MQCEVEAWLVGYRLSHLIIILRLTSLTKNHCMHKKCNLVFLCISSNLDINLNNEVYAIRF
jgi:hypothetical protein